MMDWQTFVALHGVGARADHLAHIVGVEVCEVQKLRSAGVGTGLRGGYGEDRFADLFRLWNGRSPEDSDWPPPRRPPRRTEYEWQPPEKAFLAGLVGRFGMPDIQALLSTRLQQLTGDQSATRGKNAVQLMINRLGLQSSDVVGGISVKEAAILVGSKPIIDHAIRAKELRTFRVGRLHVIPHKVWNDWLASRGTVPLGYVKLSTLKVPLAFKSDKLSEFARAGKVPGAIQVETKGYGDDRSKFPTWYIPEALATKLIEDRRLGRPMPWHGVADTGNLKVTWKLFQVRRHPLECETCQQIWGESGAPTEFDDYVQRYPPLAHGAKRHLTRVWTPGLSLKDLATDSGQPMSAILDAIESGTLPAHGYRATRYVSRTDATMWISRGCPTGKSEHSWATVPTAAKQFDFTESELLEMVEKGELAHKIGTNGPMRGLLYVSRWQCRMIRSQRGYTEAQAAAKLRIGVPRLRELLETVNWRGAKAIPLVTIQAVKKRLESREGFTIDQAAIELHESEDWVREQIANGVVKVSRAPWDHRRQYLSAPMMARLRTEQACPTVRERWSDNWLLVGKAATLAGVSTMTLQQWAHQDLVTYRASKKGQRYSRRSVMDQARRYWTVSRFKRDLRPQWLIDETAEITPSSHATAPNNSGRLSPHHSGLQ